eukprot:m.111039 g.111039  ORF g.111039 m.111039 type:complete len:57 (-) comp9231_c0_seq15:3370-3540(-)
MATTNTLAQLVPKYFLLGDCSVRKELNEAPHCNYSSNVCLKMMNCETLSLLEGFWV